MENTAKEDNRFLGIYLQKEILRKNIVYSPMLCTNLDLISVKASRIWASQMTFELPAVWRLSCLVKGAAICREILPVNHVILG